MTMIKFALAALLVSCSVAQAQQYQHGIRNYNPNAATVTPDGATGPGVVSTGTVVGQVIAVSNPVMENVPIGQSCQQNYYPNQSQNYQQPQQYPQQQMGSQGQSTSISAFIGSAQSQGGRQGRGAQVISGIAGTVSAYQNSGSRGMPQGGYQQPQFQQQYQQQYQQPCQQQFQQQSTGYHFVAQYKSYQVEGFTQRNIRVGDNVTIYVRQIIYAGD